MVFLWVHLVRKLKCFVDFSRFFVPSIFFIYSFALCLNLLQFCSLAGKVLKSKSQEIRKHFPYKLSPNNVALQGENRSLLYDHCLASYSMPREEEVSFSLCDMLLRLSKWRSYSLFMINKRFSTAAVNHHCAINFRENIACIAWLNREVKLFLNNLHRVLRPELQD